MPVKEEPAVEVALKVPERPAIVREYESSRPVRIVELDEGHPAEPPARLWGRGVLIALMVKREFSGKYRGSLLGTMWPVINPVGHLILYTFLFCVVLKVRLGTDASM